MESQASGESAYPRRHHHRRDRCSRRTAHCRRGRSADADVSGVAHAAHACTARLGSARRASSTPSAARSGACALVCARERRRWSTAKLRRWNVEGLCSQRALLLGHGAGRPAAPARAMACGADRIGAAQSVRIGAALHVGVGRDAAAAVPRRGCSRPHGWVCVSVTVERSCEHHVCASAQAYVPPHEQQKRTSGAGSSALRCGCVGLVGPTGAAVGGPAQANKHTQSSTARRAWRGGAAIDPRTG
jgi:hypothetical protein